MIKMIFLIHDLGPGGAEKVLVNLVNNMDPEKFDITVMSLFGGGVNEQFLKPHVRYISCFRRMIPGNSHLMKILTPKQLHGWLIKEEYDIEVSYLEGPSARIISGCSNAKTQTVTWIHCLATPKDNVTLGFRSYKEARNCYAQFDRVICVSQTAKEAFESVFPNVKNVTVKYNTNDSALIGCLAGETVNTFCSKEVRLVGVGKLIPVKAFDRLIRIHAKLRTEGYPVHTYLLGEGALRPELERLTAEMNVKDSVTFLGFQSNPYQYVANCDLFVCCSLSEGFSTAATEALIVGTPVCTVEVSGMRELLGENNEYGIVTENSEEALYQGIKRLLDDPALLEYYRMKARERGRSFYTEETVKMVEQMFVQMVRNKK